MKTIVLYFILLLNCITLSGQIRMNENQYIKVDFAKKGRGFMDDFKVNQINTINDKLYALGVFETINSTPCKNAIVFDGIKWSPLSIGDDFVEGHGIIQYKGNIYISGTWGNGRTKGLKMLNPNGKWNYVGTGKSPTFDDNPIMVGNGNEQLTIKGMTVFNDELICAGEVGAIGTINENIIKWNGTSWSKLTPNNPFRLEAITDVIVFRGQLYFGGKYGFMGDPNSPLIKLEGDSLRKVVFGKKIGQISKMAVFNNDLIIATDQGLYKWDGNYCSTLLDGREIKDLLLLNNELYFTGSYQDRINVLHSSLQIKYIDIPIESGQKGLGFYRGSIVTPFCTGCRN